jgi:hypothetical protein
MICVMFRGLIIALCALCLVCTPAAVWAQDVPEPQGLLTRYLTAFPDVPPIDAQDFRSATEVADVTPFDDPTLRFAVRVPRTWTGQEIWSGGAGTLADKVEQPLARYESLAQPGGRSRLEINAARFTYLMTPAQWFLKRTLTSGYTMKGMEISGDGRRVEALYVTFESGAAEVVRAVMEQTGREVIIARYTMPVGRWENEAPLQAAVAQSLELASPALDLRPEEIRTHLFLDIARLDYPASWRLIDPPIRSIDRISADLLNVTADGALDGEIRVVAASRVAGPTVAEEVERLQAWLADKDLEIGDRLEVREDVPTPPGMTLTVTEVYAVRGTQKSGRRSRDRAPQPQELWVTVAADAEYTYISAMLTAARDLDYFIWARNVEAYKFVARRFGSQDTGDADSVGG